MPDFAARATTPELMDDELTDFDAYTACLADLARVNRATFTHRPTLAFLKRLKRQQRLPADRPLRLLDIASGHGDLLRAVAGWAERSGVVVELTGLDLNPLAARAAAAVTDPAAPIEWVTTDLFDYRPAAQFDVVTSTQFAHHLDNAGIVRLLARMDALAGIGWLLTDLQRHRLPYHVFSLWARLAGWHRIVRYDGLVSITRSLRLREWRALVKEGELARLPIDVRWQVPFRIAVSRIKPC